MIQEHNAARNQSPRKRKGNEEHKLQVACVAWFRLQYKKHAPLLFSIPNGAKLFGATKIDRAKNWNKLQAEGAVAGAADLFLAIPSGDLSGLFIEMKTKKGRQSETQKAFEEAVISVGYGYAMPRSFSEFRDVVSRYIEKGDY